MPGQGTIPDSLKVDHLLLLVGGNPLPNAVAGKLLLKPGGRIPLLHSCGMAGTGPIAARLTDWFARVSRDKSEHFLRKRVRVKRQEGICWSLR